MEMIMKIMRKLRVQHQNHQNTTSQRQQKLKKFYLKFEIFRENLLSFSFAVKFSIKFSLIFFFLLMEKKNIFDLWHIDEILKKGKKLSRKKKKKSLKFRGFTDTEKYG